MKVLLSKQAVKALEAMDGATRERITQAVLGIPQGDIKSLQGYSDGKLRLRVGKYRVVFAYEMIDDEKAVAVLDIGSRGDVYK